MIKRLVLLAALLGCFSVAQAKLYIGVLNSNIIVGDGVAPTVGLSVGSYDLFGPVGLRASALTSILSFGANGFLEGSLDGTLSFGEGVVFYTGVGLGYSNFVGGNATLGAFVGLDLDASTAISLFLEARPVIYLGTVAAFQARAGFNFHLGGTAGGESVQGKCCIIP